MSTLNTSVIYLLGQRPIIFVTLITLQGLGAAHRYITIPKILYNHFLY